MLDWLIQNKRLVQRAVAAATLPLHVWFMLYVVSQSNISDEAFYLISAVICVWTALLAILIGPGKSVSNVTRDGLYLLKDAMGVSSQAEVIEKLVATGVAIHHATRN